MDGAAAVHEFHVIHGPNTRNARNALLAFHTFLVEVHPNEAKIESGSNYITAAHAFVIVRLRLGVADSSGSPAIKDVGNYLSHKLPIIRTYLVEVSPAKDGGLGGGLSNK